MSEESAFLDAIQAEPANDALRLVYADWLEEHGQLKSRYLRLIHELVLVPQDVRLGSPLHDEMLALTPIINSDWQQAVGHRFEVALLDYSTRDRGDVIFVLMQLLQNLYVPLEIEDLADSVPAVLLGPVTYADAVFFLIDWHRQQSRFEVRPTVVLRPTPMPDYGPQTCFDVVLKQLPPEFWPHWPQYKFSIADLLGLGTREAADRIRSLPAVLFRSVPSVDLEPTRRRIRQAFNRVGAELLPAEAVSFVPNFK